MQEAILKEREGHFFKREQGGDGSQTPRDQGGPGEMLALNLYCT